jgi:hypothetical protein
MHKLSLPSLGAELGLIMISVETSAIGYSTDAHTDDHLTFRAGFSNDSNSNLFYN